MPDARISELPAAAAPADTDLTALVQTSGASLVTNKATVAQLRAAVLDGRAAHVRDFGAKGDGTTNDAPAIQAAINALAAKNGGVLHFDAKTYRLASAISIGTTAVRLQGQGFVEGATPGNGTWFKLDTTGFTPITFTGTAARGGGIADIAIYQVHSATQNASWAPTNYDYVVRVQDCLGGIDIRNLFLCNVNRGIYCDNSGRLDIDRLRGQVFTCGVEIDDAYDVVKLRNIHFWPFATSNNFVLQYAQANCDALLLRRVDGAFIDQLFVFAARSMARFSGGTAGVTTKFYIGQAYADFCQYGVLVEGAGTDGLIDSLTTQGQAWGTASSPVAASNGIRVSAPSCRLQVGNLRVDLVQDNAIRVEQYGNRLDINALRCVNFNAQNNGSAAIHIVDSGSNPANVVYLGAPALLEGVTGPLQNSGSNGVLATGTPPGVAARPGLSVGGGSSGLFQPSATTLAASAGGVEVLRGTSGGGLTLGGTPGAHAFEVATPSAATNRLLVTGAATGSGASLAAQGGDANVALLLADKGSGGIQAQSNGGLAVKIDTTAANPVNYIGLRAATGSTAPLVYAAGSGTNLDLALAAQGSGLVRAVTAPTADNSTAVATTAWVRAQGYSTSGSGGFIAPSWTTAGRPSPATAGMIGWNTDLLRYDHCTASGTPGTWKQFARLDGDTLTAALLVNSAGGGNVARLSGAASGGPVVIGVDASSADTNVGVVLGSPKGSGAISAQQPDSATTGGNGRGANAVDWQTSRTAATQVASGTSATILGGSNNTASGTNSTAGGSACTASATYAVAIGRGNLAGGIASMVTGQQGTARGLYGVRVHAANNIAAQGDAQLGEYPLAGRSTAGATVRLTADATGTAGATNVANIPNNTAWGGAVMVTARDTSTGNCARWSIPLGIGRQGSASTTTLATGTVEFFNIIGTAAASGNLAASADTTNGGLNLSFTPPNSNTWDVVAILRVAEVQ